MKHVLIVEDHVERAALLREALLRMSTPLDLTQTTTARQAVAALVDRPFGVVLLDFDFDLDGTLALLDTGSGADVAAEIVRRGGPPVVVHSRNFMQAQAVVALLLRHDIAAAWVPLAGRLAVQAPAVAATALALCDHAKKRS